MNDFNKYVYKRMNLWGSETGDITGSEAVWILVRFKSEPLVAR